MTKFVSVFDKRIVLIDSRWHFEMRNLVKIYNFIFESSAKPIELWKWFQAFLFKSLEIKKKSTVA